MSLPGGGASPRAAGAAGGGGGPTDAGRFRVEAEALVFGFPNTRVVLTVRRRPMAWRVGGAARMLALFMVISLFAAMVPPHAPWMIGALALGAILARRRWTERFTLEHIQGACPKCGEPLAVKRGRLRVPHSVTCEACHHQTALRFPEEALQHAPATGSP